MSPEIPFVNYTDEVVAFTDDPSLVHSFMTKFDDMWLGGLLAATSYAYQPMVGGSPVSAEATFKTAPRAGSGTISFIAFGDSGTGSVEQRQLGEIMSQDSFDFAMHVGDIAYGNSAGTGAATYATYQSYLFDVYGWLSSRAFVPPRPRAPGRTAALARGRSGVYHPAVEDRWVGPC